MGTGVFVLGAECSRWQRSSACLFYISRSSLPFSQVYRAVRRHRRPRRAPAATTNADSSSALSWGKKVCFYLIQCKTLKFSTNAACSGQTFTQWLSVFKPQQMKWIKALLWERCNCFVFSLLPDNIPGIGADTLLILLECKIISYKSDLYRWPDRLHGRFVTFLGLSLCTFYEVAAHLLLPERQCHRGVTASFEVNYEAVWARLSFGFPLS